MAAVESITGRRARVEDLLRFERYLDLFLRWNRIHRMTALDSPSAIIRELFLDSLLFLRLLPRPPLSVVDIGAGAGIPGLPLKLAEPRIALTLVEAKRKRVSFLLAALRELEIDDVRVEEGRAEALVDQDSRLACRFDAAVSRAVAPADQLFQVARKYLKPGGLFVSTGAPHLVVQGPLEAVRVEIPGGRRSRTLVRAIKES